MTTDALSQFPPVCLGLLVQVAEERAEVLPHLHGECDVPIRLAQLRPSGVEVERSVHDQATRPTMSCRGRDPYLRDIKKCVNVNPPWAKSLSQNLLVSR